MQPHITRSDTENADSIDSQEVYTVRIQDPQDPLLASKQESRRQPRLHSAGAILSFPFLECFVVATLGFDNLTRVWILVKLDLTWLACTRFRFGSWCTTTGLRVKQINNVPQAEAVLTQQASQLFSNSISFLRPESLFIDSSSASC